MKPLSDIEFVQVDKSMWKTLFQLLDLQPICSMCGDTFPIEDCGGVMPALNDEKIVVLCKSILCTSDYLTRRDDES